MVKLSAPAPLAKLQVWSSVRKVGTAMVCAAVLFWLMPLPRFKPRLLVPSRKELPPANVTVLKDQLYSRFELRLPLPAAKY